MKSRKKTKQRWFWLCHRTALCNGICFSFLLLLIEINWIGLGHSRSGLSISCIIYGCSMNVTSMRFQSMCRKYAKDTTKYCSQKKCISAQLLTHLCRASVDLRATLKRCMHALKKCLSCRCDILRTHIHTRPPMIEPFHSNNTFLLVCPEHQIQLSCNCQQFGSIVN